MPQWQNSTRRDRLPADWSLIRKRRLRKDLYRCQWKLEDGTTCDDYANQVDHKIPGDDHRQENLQSLCEPHHTAKSSSEGGAALAEKRRQIRRKFRRESDACPILPG